MTIFIPLLVALIGLIIYGLTDGKLSEVGRVLFWTGTLVTLWHLAGSARLL